MTGIELIATERIEQLTKHGRTIESDVLENRSCQLSYAASMLSVPHIFENHIGAACPSGWEFEAWAKLCRKPHMERLIIAGALIAAEIDRLTYEAQNINPQQ